VDCPGFDPTPKTLLADVLALLKAQEPEALDMPKPDSDIGCWYDITNNYTLEQVVSALKAQEPRVITDTELEEIRKVPLILKPNVDAVPVVHGRWIEIEDSWGDCHYQCAECGEEWNLDAGTPAENNMNYCPNCGAKMDGERRDES
jgi:DNA-directed RNA polymerase subunit RPC12/RpoP